MHNDYHSKPHTPDTGPLGRCMPGSMLHSVTGDSLVSASVHSKTRTPKFSESFPCLLLYIRLFFVFNAVLSLAPLESLPENSASVPRDEVNSVTRSSSHKSKDSRS